MSMRSSLGRVRGLGSAKEGAGHWWVQRLTAIALVPLSLWFVISVIGLIGVDHAALRAWMGVPGNTALMALFLGTLFHHAQLGAQVVIEDYVHGEAAKTAGIIIVKLLAWALGVFSIVAVLKVAFGG
ncbi:MAG: succinate dehydrogenase, hydrophobic membrane anchor protein [Alphaproteobacteria bacterium]|nr:succinate dehydrogenase, hydrophobic membrane anchor protein [Alphaproteobacteria bacterium]